MNKTKMKVIGVLLAFIMIVTSFAAIGFSLPNNANALIDGYNGEDSTIYYFSDSATPVLDETTLIETYGDSGFNIVYDMSYGLNSELLKLLIENNYFDGFGSRCIVIIELTNDLYDSDVLLQLFEILKSQGCTVIFVSAYGITSYSFAVEEWVDAFMLASECYTYYDFIVDAVEDMANNGLSKTSCIIISSQFLDVSSYAGDIRALCESSVFLRVLLICLYDRLEELYDDFGYEKAVVDDDISYIDFYNLDIEEYINMAYALNSVGFKILVQVGDDTRFLNLLGYDTSKSYNYNVLDVEEYPSLLLSLEVTEFFAMGLWELPQDLYDLLWNWQWQYEHASIKVNIRIYVYEVDTIRYSEDGLGVITDTCLNSVYGTGNKKTKNSSSLLWLLSLVT